jgi:dolichol-phosphate mannosyltransferase
MKTLVIVPCYNEAVNIENLTTSIHESEQDVDILVIDDNSPDGTGNIVKKLQEKDKKLFLIEREGKLGLGSAYARGFKYALENDYNFIITIDADFSHNPKYIPGLIAQMPNVDICIGSRYVPGALIKDWGILRKIVSKSANKLAQIVLGSRQNDNTTGFRCYKAEVIKDLLNADIKSNGYSYLVEVAHLLQKRNYKIGEIPIIFEDRRAGNSKISKKEIMQSAKMLFRLGFKRL